MFLLGLIASVCYVPGVFGAFIATQWPLLSAVLPFGLLRKGPFTVFHALGLAFVGYALVRAPFAPLPAGTVFGLWLLIIMALAVWWGTTLESVRGLYAGLAIGAAVSSAVAVLQHFGMQGPVFIASASPGGLYVNSVQLGTVTALLIVALASERMWLFIPALLPGLMVAHSRGGWLALAVGLFGCLFRRVWVLGILAAAAAVLLLSPISSSDQLRLQIWRVSYDLLSVLGIGPGMFYLILMPWQNGFVYPEYAHNEFLQLVTEYGVGALAPFAVFAFALTQTRATEWPVWLAFVTAACYSMPMYMPVGCFLAFVALGRILRTHGVDSSDRLYRRLAGLSKRALSGVENFSVAPYNHARGGQ